MEPPSPDSIGAVDSVRAGDIRGRLHDLAEALRPEVARARTIGELEGLFRSGRVPDPLPDGFLSGRLLATTTWAPLDGLFRRLASLWMPWQGKAFDPSSKTGVNRFTPDVRVPMRLMWPGYAPIRSDGERVEAFLFRNRVAPGAADPDLQVLKIDYDLEANPSLVIRRILDELVQIADGVYLGKVLLRSVGSFRRIGFFSLTS